MKSFLVKLYSPAGSFLRTLPPDIIRTSPSFAARRNGGYGECVLDLNLPFDDFSGYLSGMEIAKIEVASDFHPTGTTVYTGFVSKVQPYLTGSSEGVKVTLLGLVSLLSFDYYKNGSSFTVAHSAQDPAVILKAIIDHFGSVQGSGLIGYDSGGTTIETVGSNASITFTDSKWFDAIKTAAQAAGAGWYFLVDRLGQIHLHSDPTTATHAFTIGKDIESIDAPLDFETIQNAVQVRYNGGSVDVTDSASIAAYFRRGSILSDTKLQNSATATNAGEAVQVLEPTKAITLTVNSNYDIESVYPGQSCKIRNIKPDLAFLGDCMLIEEVRYELDRVRLTLNMIKDDIAAEIVRLG